LVNLVDCRCIIITVVPCFLGVIANSLFDTEVQKPEASHHTLLGLHAKTKGVSSHALGLLLRKGDLIAVAKNRGVSSHAFGFACKKQRRVVTRFGIIENGWLVVVLWDWIAVAKRGLNGCCEKGT
jgi:hypothetical protein